MLYSVCRSVCFVCSERLFIRESVNYLSKIVSLEYELFSSFFMVDDGERKSGSSNNDDDSDYNDNEPANRNSEL